MGNKEEKNNTVPNGSKETTGRRHKSARPGRISYVPINDEDLAPYEPPVRKKHKGLKITGIAVAMVIVSTGAAYAGMSYYYSDKFFEGTSINGIDCSGKTAYEAEQKIAKTVENYSIEVDSRNLDPQTISGDQIGYSYVSDGSVLKLLKDQKPYEWIRGFFETKNYMVQEETVFSREKLEEQVSSLNCAKKENQIAPENAYVSFSNSEFTIVPETEGSELNAVKEVLAYEVTKLIHGEEEAEKAQEGARALFGSGANTDNMPSTTFTAADFADGQLGILDMLMKANLAPSKKEGRRLVEQGGISVNDVKITNPTEQFTAEDFKDGYIIVKKGKKVFHKIVLS